MQPPVSRRPISRRPISQRPPATGPAPAPFPAVAALRPRRHKAGPRDAFPAIVLGLLALLLAALMAAVPAMAQDLPARPTGPVYDGANILQPAQEAALDRKLGNWTQQSGRPVVVATVPDLGGRTIEMYAADLYEKWGIGPKDTDQGVLLLVAPQQRRVRIEVGYGLTPYITDILSGRIIRNDITPRFRDGDYAGGIDAGVNALIAQLSKAPEDARAIAQAAEQAERQRRGGGGGGGFPIVGTLFWLGLIGAFIFLFGRGGGGRRYRRGGAGSVARDVILWSAISHLGGRGGGFGGGGGGGFGGGGGGGFGGFGGGMSGGGGASGGW